MLNVGRMLKVEAPRERLKAEAPPRDVDGRRSGEEDEDD